MVSTLMVVAAFLVVSSMPASVLRAAGGSGLSAAVTGGVGAARAAAARATGCVIPLPLPAALVSTPFLLGVSVTVTGA